MEVNHGAAEEAAQPETDEPDHPELDDDELLELQAQGLVRHPSLSLSLS